MRLTKITYHKTKINCVGGTFRYVSLNSVPLSLYSVMDGNLAMANVLENNVEPEEWKPILGYEGYYEVSTYGNVKSFYSLEAKTLKPAINGEGYLTVVLSNNGKAKTKTIHQLVAIAFLNHKPNGMKMVVDHIDCNKINNYVLNLQIITHRANSSKDKKFGSSKYIGVSWSRQNNKWRARIKIHGKEKFLGYFIEELEASKAYQNNLKANERIVGHTSFINDTNIFKSSD